MVLAADRAARDGVVRNETRGTTFLVVTHSRDLAEQIPRVVHMLDGRIESDRKNGH